MSIPIAQYMFTQYPQSPNRNNKFRFITLLVKPFVKLPLPLFLIWMHIICT